MLTLIRPGVAGVGGASTIYGVTPLLKGGAQYSWAVTCSLDGRTLKGVGWRTLV